MDYSRLNQSTVADTYKLPQMDDLIDSIGEAVVFSNLDSNFGYWQVPIAAEDRDKTCFTTHMGTYRYKRMTFGFLNELETF